MTPATPQKAQSGALHPLPPGLALVGGSIQLASCGTRFVRIGVPIGLAVGIAAVACGHFILWRRWRGGRAERWLAWFALIAAYLSVLIIPIVGYGILFFVMGSGH